MVEALLLYKLRRDKKGHLQETFAGQSKDDCGVEVREGYTIQLHGRR
jgi:hypothetical protein